MLQQFLIKTDNLKVNLDEKTNGSLLYKVHTVPHYWQLDKVLVLNRFDLLISVLLANKLRLCNVSVTYCS